MTGGRLIDTRLQFCSLLPRRDVVRQSIDPPLIHRLLLAQTLLPPQLPQLVLLALPPHQLLAQPLCRSLCDPIRSLEGDHVTEAIEKR